MENWKICCGKKRKTLGKAKIQKGIFQPQVFVIAMILQIIYLEM